MSICNKCKQSFSRTLLVAAGVMFALQSQALDLTLDPDELQPEGPRDAFIAKSFTAGTQIRGYAITEAVYFGQSKVAGEYGVGFVVDRDDNVSLGISHRGVSITKVF